MLTVMPVELATIRAQIYPPSDVVFDCADISERGRV